MKVLIKKLVPEAIIPERKSEYAAGVDLHSVDEVVIGPGERTVVSTGLAIEMLEFGHTQGYVTHQSREYQVGMICSRSGLAANEGIFVLNAPGIIDEDYRGELKVILFNSSGNSYYVKRGDRIAQFLLLGYHPIEFNEVEDLNMNTERGTNGFGSTGKN